MEDYEKDFEEFWADVVLNKDGAINLDQVKRELFDYHTLMHSASEVYESYAGISNPSVIPSQVIEAGEEEQGNFYRGIYGDDVLDILEDYEAPDELVEAIKDYFKG